MAPEEFVNVSAGESAAISTEPLLESERVWTKLVKKTYKDPHGTIRTWESAERTTRHAGSDIDGVGIVAILENSSSSSQSTSSEPSIVLQKQYRPPLDKIVIEIPAGLSDPGESPSQTAIRELREETGYHVSQVLETSPVMYNDPGFCNTNLRMVHVSVDMSDERNQEGNLKPELEEGEFIECFVVKLTDLWDEIVKLEREGYAIDARIANLAEGIELAKKFKLT
ncbi:NUDIX hydrolase domain-like protein [Naviculisporaceae sp. PSN 640]